MISSCWSTSLEICLVMISGRFTMAKTQGQRIAEAEGRWSSAELGTSSESKETTTRKQVKIWIPCILIGCIHLNLYKLLFISIHFCLGNLTKVIFEAIHLVWKVCPFILNQWTSPPVVPPKFSTRVEVNFQEGTPYLRTPLHLAVPWQLVVLKNMGFTVQWRN